MKCFFCGNDDVIISTSTGQDSDGYDVDFFTPFCLHCMKEGKTFATSNDVEENEAIEEAENHWLRILKAVEMHDELVSLLDDVIDSIGSEYQIPSNIYRKIESVLKKARGE